MILALVFSPLMVRVTGTAFAMLHLAFGQLMYVLALKLRTITGGEDGIGRFPIPPLNVPGIGSISMKNPENFFYFGIIILGLSIWLMWFFTKTPLGQVQIGLRDNAKRIDYLGYKVPQTKAVLYVVSGAFAGVAGSIYGLFQNLVSCDGVLGILVSFAPITNTVVGGIGSFFGPIWGTDRIRDFLNREASPPASSIFKALVLGEQGDIPEEIKEYFILTGTAHLLAISGDQFGIVALLSFSLLIWILKRSKFLLLSVSVRKWAAGLTIPCIVLYAFIAGGGISVIRAAIMVITFLVSILLDRERNLLHTLALAAFLILIFSPPSLFDVSFQLSFLAVLSILYLLPRILQEFKQEGISALLKTSWKKNIMKYIMLSLLVTAVAIIGTAPFVALHFNRFAPIGFFTNLFIVPWVGFLIVPLSLAASVFSFFFTPLATLLIAINSFITLMLLRVLAFFASLPLASLFVSTPTLFEIILFYLLLFLSVHVKKRRMARYLFLGVCLVSAFDVAFWNLRDSFQKDLRLSFIDVGHGDSILIEFPQGKRMLIDGGGLYDDRFDTGKNVIAPFLWSRKIRRIDALVLTHPDPDHLKGLNFIASQFSIGQFWDNGFQTESESYLQLRKILNERKIKTRSLTEETLPQTVNGVEISVLNPPVWKAMQKGTQNLRDLNNSSLVMRLRFKNVSVLLAGDIGKEAEERMLRRDYPLRSDILKIPHHGSSTSSTTPFLERVKPTHAILSVGERNIGRLPHPEVLKRYQQVGATLYRTDRQGTITAVTDGENIHIETFSGARSRN